MEHFRIVLEIKLWKTASDKFWISLPQLKDFVFRGYFRCSSNLDFSLSNAVSFTGLITYFSFSPTLLAEYAYVLAEGVSHLKTFF